MKLLKNYCLVLSHSCNSLAKGQESNPLANGKINGFPFAREWQTEFFRSLYI